MSSPTLTLNLQLNIYPDGTVDVVTQNTSSAPPKAKTRKPTVIAKAPAPNAPPAAEAPAKASPAAEAPAPAPITEADLRKALLAAAKAVGKTKAVEVLSRIAGVERIPDADPVHYAAILAEWESQV